MKELNEGIIEKKIIIGGDQVNAVSFDGRGAIFRNKPNVPVSDFALLLGMQIDRRIQYPFDCTYPCGKKVNIDRKGGANDGARPVLPINDLIKLGANIKIEDKEIIFGEFPQTVVKDKKLILLIKEILYAQPRTKGLEIGNYTSQMFANIYLNEIDQYIKHKLHVRTILIYLLNVKLR